MNRHAPISRLINLIEDESQRLWSTDAADARLWLLAGDTDRVLGLGGSFALVAQDGRVTHLAVEAPGQFDVSRAEAVLAAL